MVAGEFGEGADVLVGRLVRQGEPGVGADLVGEGDHHLDRRAAPGEGVVVGPGPVGPGGERRVVGGHPVHEADHPQVLDARDPGRVEHRAGLEELDVLGLHDLDVADVVAGGCRVARGDRQEDEALARRVVEPDLAGLADDVPDAALQAEVADAAVGQAIASGQRYRCFRLVGEQERRDAGELRRDPLRPAGVVERARGGERRRGPSRPIGRAGARSRAGRSSSRR